MALRGHRKQTRSRVKNRNRKQNRRKSRGFELKPQFKRAIIRLSKESPVRRKAMIKGTSNVFIKDFGTTLRNQRMHRESVSPRHARLLKRHDR